MFSYKWYSSNKHTQLLCICTLVGFWPYPSYIVYIRKRTLCLEHAQTPNHPKCNNGVQYVPILLGSTFYSNSPVPPPPPTHSQLSPVNPIMAMQASYKGPHILANNLCPIILFLCQRNILSSHKLENQFNVDMIIWLPQTKSLLIRNTLPRSKKLHNPEIFAFQD